MKKLFYVSAIALSTILSCQNDSDVEKSSTVVSVKPDNKANLKEPLPDVEDNFSGTKLDSKYWKVITGTKKVADGMDIKEWSNESNNIEVKDGRLRLRSYKTSKDKITTARIQSEGLLFQKSSGYFEAKMYINNPASTNVQSAFWLYPANQGTAEGGLDGAEIDVFESTNGLDRYPATLHIDDNTSKKTWGQTGDFPGSTNGYHTYGVEWTSTYIKIYYDRKQVGNQYSDDSVRFPKQLYFKNQVQWGETHGTKKYDWIPTVNEYVILSVAPAWGNAAKGLAAKPTGTTTYTYIDYVKYWKNKPF